MKFKLVVSQIIVAGLALSACLTSSACGDASKAQSKELLNPVPNKEDRKMDQERSKLVPVVLRVKFERLLGGQKYAWDEVSVLSVLKNESKRTFAGSLEIAYYDWEPGIPKGESTVYLTPYTEGDESRWKLLGGSAKEGVSHAEAGEAKQD